MIEIGKILFYIGLFLLPSAFSLGSILLIISLIFSFTLTKETHYDDKLNFIFTIWDLCHRDNVEFPEIKFKGDEITLVIGVIVFEEILLILLINFLG